MLGYRFLQGSLMGLDTLLGFTDGFSGLFVVLWFGVSGEAYEREVKEGATYGVLGRRHGV